MNPLHLPFSHPRQHRVRGQLSVTGCNPNQETFLAPQIPEAAAFSGNPSPCGSRIRNNLNAVRGNNSQYEQQRQTALAAKLIDAAGHHTGSIRCSFPGMSRIQPYPSMTVPQRQASNVSEPTGPVITPNCAFNGRERQQVGGTLLNAPGSVEASRDAQILSPIPHPLWDLTHFRTK